MTLVLLLAGGWIALSLAVMPLAARMLRSRLVCGAGMMHPCRNASGCAAAGRCLAAEFQDTHTPDPQNPV